MPSTFDNQFAEAAEHMLTVFGEPATYFPEGEAGQSITAMFDEQERLGEGSGFDPTYRPSLARYAVIELKVEDVPDLAYQEVVRREADGISYRVRQLKREGSMWRAWCSADERGAF